MKSIKIAAGALVAATLLAGAPAASAAGPVDVLVRIEGVDSTIQPRMSLRTSTGTVTKDGQHSCTGTSAAGALEIATRGDWTGPWSDAYGYGIDVVKGNAHPFFSGNYWAFYVNDVAQSTGICGRELSAGEEVLFVPQPEDPAKTKGLLRLSGVPARIAPGEAVTVTVTRHTSEFATDPPYTPSGKSAPAANATVTGNGVTLTTDAQGRASFVPAARGELDLRATRDGDVRSATERLCVTDGADGACGTTAPAPCVTNGSDGLCGSPDRRAAFGVVKSVSEQQRFARGKGPRELTGAVEADPAGLESVRLRLVRNDDGRCARFDEDRLELRRTKTCRITAGKWFTVGATADWRYLLPERLPRGRYVLDVEVRDKAGNVNRTWQRGRNRVVFHVA